MIIIEYKVGRRDVSRKRSLSGSRHCVWRKNGTCDVLVEEPIPNPRVKVHVELS